MGMRQSAYEKSGPLNYVKLSPEECAMIRDLWSEIENKPQVYGNLFFSSFLEAYPQYIKFFTLEPNLPLNMDVRTTAKFTAIVEALGYLLLDFYDKPKRLNRFVGHLAMMHKDMRLDNQDVSNMGFHLIDFLVESFPLKMSEPCREVITKFIVDVVNEMARKMDYFRNYETISRILDTRPSRSPCGQCTVFTDNLIFGQTRVYWSERKREWDARLDEWTGQEPATVEPEEVGSLTYEDNSSQQSNPNEDTSGAARPINATRKVSIQSPYSSSKLKLQSLAKKLNSEGSATNVLADRRPVEKIRDDEPEDGRHYHGSLRSSRGEGMTPRERFRVQSVARDAFSPHTDATVLRRRLRSSRIAVARTASQNVDDRYEDGPLRDRVQIRKFSNTARERRRETKQFSVDLK